MSLKQKAVSGLLWTFTQQFSIQLINFVISVVLARVLLPAEFGLIAMLSIFLSIGRSLMDSGLTSSLIRTTDADQKDYSTVFFVNIIGSVVCYLILFLSAPFIASFYKQELLSAILRVYSLTFIIQAFVGVQRTRLTKEMNFKTQMTIQIPSVVVSGALGVYLAYAGYGVWSIVYMNLFQSLLSTIQHWYYSKWRPDFSFDMERFRKHFDFGYKMTLSGLLTTVYDNIYVIIIGKYFSATQLGFYNRALTLRQLPISNISTALDKVTYPMFSSIDDDNKLKIAYRKLMLQVVFWMAPLLIFLAVVAEPLIRLLLTEKWLPAVPYFQILCFAGIMYAPSKYNLNILKVKGRSDLHFKLEVVKKIFITLGILAAVPYGIYGLLYFQLISTLFMFLVNTYYSGLLIKYPVSEQAQDLLPILVIALVTGALSWMFDKWLLSFNMFDISRLVLGGILYSLVYLGINTLIKSSPILDFREIVFKKQFKS